MLIGGSYVGAIAAGVVVSAQLWLHALSTDERAAIRELALPGTQERSVSALVEPARPRAVRAAVSPSPFAGFAPIFASNGPLTDGLPAPSQGQSAAGVPVRGSDSTASTSPAPVTVSTDSAAALTASAPATGSVHGPTVSVPPNSLARGTSARVRTSSPGRVKKTHHASVRATQAVRAQPARPRAIRPATSATPAVAPGPTKPPKVKPEQPKPPKPPKQKETTAAPAAQTATRPAPSDPSDPGKGGDNGHGNGNRNGKGK
jgi:hypothetical protein